MPPRKDIDAAGSVPAFYGAELRWKREAAGMTLQELAEGKFYSIAYLSQIEMGDRRMPHDLAVHADAVLGTDGFFRRRCEDARKARRGGHAEYFADVVAMEKQASVIEEWSPILLSGLLQTGEYARRVARAGLPRATDDEVEAQVSARLTRAELFLSATPPEYWVVMDESVLRRPLLPPADMADQLSHIMEMMRQTRGILQILPCNTPAHPFMTGTALLLSFSEAPTAVYTEGLHTGQLIDDGDLVEKYRKSYDLLRAAALAPEESLALVETLGEDYRNDAQPQ